MDFLDAGQEDSFDGDIARKVACKCGLFVKGFRETCPFGTPTCPAWEQSLLSSDF